MEEQFVLPGFEGCGCWIIRTEMGFILAGHSCPDCVARALDYLEGLLYLDKVVSVSGLLEGEKS